MRLVRGLAFCSLFAIQSFGSGSHGGMMSPAEGYLVYIGTYTGQGSEGIYAWRFNPATGDLVALGLVAKAANPSFLAVHPDGQHLYAVGETSAAGRGGSVSAFSIDRGTGRLTLLNAVSSRGDGPCHVAVDWSGRAVLVANYGGGSVAAFPLNQDGRLGEATAFAQHEGSSVNPARQKGPHAHSINLSPDNRFAVAADLGLDQLLIYRFDPAKAALTPNDPPSVRVKPGAGPRHFAFHPDGRHAYVINELQSTVTAFEWNAERGILREVQTLSTLPEGFTGTNSTAEVQVHLSGRFVYGSNRGHDSIAIFAVDPGRGTLSPLGHAPTGGSTPRNFAVDPSGSWLFAANQKTGNVVVFRIDPGDGRLAEAGRSFQVSSPVCVRFVPVR